MEKNMPANINDIEGRLLDAADELWASSKLKASEYSVPVLGLIFLRYTDYKFIPAERDLASGRRKIGKTDYQAPGVIYLLEEARFAHQLGLLQGDNIGKAFSEVMKAIEPENLAPKRGLPKRKLP